MQQLIRTAKKVFPFFNRREITLDDCHRFCEKNKILVLRAPLEVKGYTGITKVRRRRRYYLLLDSRLRGVYFLEAFLHELGHIILHEPRGNLEVLYFRRENALETKQENEADAFMLLAMMPTKRFLQTKETPPDLLHPLTAELIIRREKLYLLCGE